MALDTEWLEHLNTLLEYADDRSEGQDSWRARSKLREAQSREVFADTMADIRATSTELRALADRLDAGAEHMAQLMR